MCKQEWQTNILGVQSGPDSEFCKAVRRHLRTVYEDSRGLQTPLSTRHARTKTSSYAADFRQKWRRRDAVKNGPLSGLVSRDPPPAAVKGLFWPLAGMACDTHSGRGHKSGSSHRLARVSGVQVCRVPLANRCAKSTLARPFL